MVPIEKAVVQNNATKVFTYGGLRAEHQAVGDHGLVVPLLTAKAS